MEEQQIKDFVQRVSSDETLRKELAPAARWRNHARRLLSSGDPDCGAVGTTTGFWRRFEYRTCLVDAISSFRNGAYRVKTGRASLNR